MSLMVLVAEIAISRQDGLAALAGSALSDSYHHHIPTGMFAGINGANRGFGGDDDIQTGWPFNN